MTGDTPIFWSPAVENFIRLQSVGMQTIFFQAKRMKFVHVKGTKNTDKKDGDDEP